VEPKLLQPATRAGVIAFVAAITACATSTSYQPMDGRYGYSEQRIEENRYRIVFKGNAATSRETVETYLLYRAAELTLDLGFDYFLVTEQETEARTTYQTTPLVYGRYRYGFHHFPYYAHGYPWAGETRTTQIRRYEAVAFVAMYKGAKPQNEPTAFDAREVISNLGSSIERPS
jgi:hypothetical protein